MRVANPNPKPAYRTPRVVFNPAACQGFQRGVNLIADAVRPTLGPLPRMVAVARTALGLRPELLDHGGTIARRIEALPNRDQDMGAMFLRHVLWHLQEEVGDGTATAAVLFQSIYNQSLHYLASGGNPVRLRQYLETGMRLILDQMAGMAIEIRGRTRLVQLAETICHDHELAAILGEVHDIIGDYGQMEIRDGRRREIEREYVEGTYWDGGVLSQEMIAGRHDLRVEMRDAAVLITDLAIQDPKELVPVLKMVLQADIPGLLITVDQISDSVKGLLLANRRPGTFDIAAVRTPESRHAEGPMNMADMAALTGGQPIAQDAGDTLGSVRLEHLGRARLTWAEKSRFGIIGGKGDPQALQAHVETLQRAFARATEPNDRKRLRGRIGRCMGGAAVVWVGGIGLSDIEVRKAVAERTAETLRGIVHDGALPGGGAAYLACVPLLRDQLALARDPDEQAAYRILVKALEMPMRTIAANAGHDASEVLAEVRPAGAPHGFDVAGGRVVNMVQAGILDSAAVHKAVIRDVISAAGLALTIEVLVQRKDPPVGVNKDAGS
jgi:chaperonin GroEL